MANQNKLKAFVRFDGSGRVIPSSIILQAKKPKVGNWKEINANECCNNTPSSTTTTTTTMSAPTQFTKPYWLNGNDACTTTTFGEITMYSSSPNFVEGIAVFLDPQLTIPVTQGYIIVNGMTNFGVAANGVLDSVFCAEFRISAIQGDVCNSSFPALQVAVKSQNTFSIGSTVYGNFSGWGYSIDQTIYLGYSPGYLVNIQLKVKSNGTAIVDTSPVAC